MLCNPFKSKGHPGGKKQGFAALQHGLTASGADSGLSAPQAAANPLILNDLLHRSNPLYKKSPNTFSAFPTPIFQGPGPALSATPLRQPFPSTALALSVTALLPGG